MTVPHVALIVLDGWGLAPDGPGNAISLASRLRTATAVTAVALAGIIATSTPVAISHPEAGSAEIEAVVSDWARQVIELGLEVKGAWLADFDNGSGYYCWRYPEEDLLYFHSYEEGFSGRMRIQ